MLSPVLSRQALTQGCLGTGFVFALHFSNLSHLLCIKISLKFHFRYQKINLASESDCLVSKLGEGTLFSAAAPVCAC